LPGVRASRREGAMEKLPELPERILRLHKLRWNELIDTHRFTGDHLKWHESRERRRQAAKPQFSLAPPPPTPLGRTPSRETFYGTDGQPVPYGEWREQQMVAWAARENQPDIIDTIGVAETVLLAKARFADVIGDYLALWAARANCNSDEFAQWSIGVAQLVGVEVCDLWRKGEWHSSWVDRMCPKKIDEALGPPVKDWGRRASKLEMQHLENPHLSLESLLGAGGSTAFALSLEQYKKTIKDAQEVLDRFNVADVPTRNQEGQLNSNSPESGTKPKAHAVGERGVSTINEERKPDPIDSFKLPPELCALLSPKDQEKVFSEVVAIDVGLRMEDPEIEQRRQMGIHLWMLFDAIAALLQSQDGFKERMVEDLIPRVVERIRRDMFWYPHDGVDLKEFHLVPVIRKWRHAVLPAQPNKVEPIIEVQFPSPAPDPATLLARAQRRRAVVDPILQQRRWKPGRLATKAGVGKNSVYDYLNGTRAKITEDNRKAIAQALGLTPDELPD